MAAGQGNAAAQSRLECMRINLSVRMRLDCGISQIIQQLSGQHLRITTLLCAEPVAIQQNREHQPRPVRQYAEPGQGAHL